MKYLLIILFFCLSCTSKSITIRHRNCNWDKESCFYVFGVDSTHQESNLLYKAYSNNSIELLDDYFDKWFKESKLLGKNNKISNNKFKIVESLINDFHKYKSKKSPMFYDAKYFIVDTILIVNIYGKIRFDDSSYIYVSADTALNTDTIRYYLSKDIVNKSSPLYLTKKHQVDLVNFLCVESDEEYRKRIFFLSKNIFIRDNCGLGCRHPCCFFYPIRITGIDFNPKHDIARVVYLLRDSSGGYMVFKKENNKWIYTGVSLYGSD